MKKRAFTLVELLVVIAIIAILVPWVLSGFKDNSKKESSVKPGLVNSENPGRVLVSGEIPELTGYVTDFTDTLSSKQRTDLGSKLEQYDQKTSNQIAVAIVDSLHGQNLEEFSMAIVEKAKIGQKDKDNGILILLSMEERKIRIEVGLGLEGVLPDGSCGRIRDNEILPRFKEGNYYQGLSDGIDKICLAIAGEYTANSSNEELGSSRRLSYIILVIVILVIVVIFVSDGNSSGGGSSYSFGGGGFGGGSSGGGFGGFGGGGFGGGGCSGGW